MMAGIILAAPNVKKLLQEIFFFRCVFCNKLMLWLPSSKKFGTISFHIVNQCHILPETNVLRFILPLTTV